MTAEKKNTSRAEQKVATRQKLLETTIKIIANEGLAGVTLPKVAATAGLSRGICNYHFRTKDQLLLETLKEVYKEHEAAWRLALSNPTLSPSARLRQFVRVLLQPPVADLKKIAVWLAYWGEAPSRRTYLEFCSAIDREFEEAVAEVLKEIPGGTFQSQGLTLRAVAVALTGMIDGFWVQYLIAPGRLNPDEAILACLTYLSGFFPQFRDYLQPMGTNS